MKKFQAAEKKIRVDENTEHKKIKESFAKQRKQNRLALVLDFEMELKAETQAGNLESAVKLRDAIKALKRGDVPPGLASGDRNVRIPSDAVSWKGHHYKLFSTNVTWLVAYQKCQRLGGHLVTMESDAEYRFVSKLRRGSAYVGATRNTESGRWEWVNGKPCRNLRWAPGQPNNRKNEDALGFENGPGLHDWFSMDKHPFICEWDH